MTGMSVTGTQIIVPKFDKLVLPGYRKSMQTGREPVIGTSRFPAADRRFIETDLTDLKRGQSFKDRTVLIGGGYEGIGLKTALAYRTAGAEVIILDLNPKTAQRFQNYKGMHGITCDLTDYDKVQHIAAEISRQRQVSVVFANAGILPARVPFGKIDFKAGGMFKKSMEINFFGNLHLAQAFYESMQDAAKSGLDSNYLFNLSRNVKGPSPKMHLYSDAKAAENQAMRVMALELGPERIRVNGISPDMVFDTKMWTPQILQASAEAKGLTVQQYMTANLLKRQVFALRVGIFAATVSSSKFGLVTGQNLAFDGGSPTSI